MIPFTDYCQRVQNRIERFYGVKVTTCDVPDPLTGDLDGAEIQIDYAVSPEQRLFLLAHLFGHTVQWNTDPHAFDLGRIVPPIDAGKLGQVLIYERQAAEYGLDVLHRIGIESIDQWFSDYSAADLDYLVHFYQTGLKLEFRQFWREGTPLLNARAVPEFQPQKRSFRMEGVVI